MKIYLVGGAVRDKLLGLPIKERDWVVVGATVQDMLAQGFRQVGKEFPVFLHPDTHEEYALARVERKTQAGYTGFIFDTSPAVTLEADLARRDLTINAMAETANGELIDPYHGKQDLENKILRHVSQAFVEDPVRILRVGRFLARYAPFGFRVAPETLTLMQQMVKEGEVNALVAERVWKELQRALSEPYPQQFFMILNDCKASSILFPHFTADNPGLKALETATHLTQDPCIRFACLLHAMPKERKKNINSFCKRYAVPNEYHQLALLTALHYEAIFQAQSLSAEQLLNLLMVLDVFRRQSRFQQFLIACEAIALSGHQLFDPVFFMDAVNLLQSIDVKKLINEGWSDKALGERIKKERVQLLSKWQKP